MKKNVARHHHFYKHRWKQRVLQGQRSDFPFSFLLNGSSETGVAVRSKVPCKMKCMQMSWKQECLIQVVSITCNLSSYGFQCIKCMFVQQGKYAWCVQEVIILVDDINIIYFITNFD